MRLRAPARIELYVAAVILGGIAVLAVIAPQLPALVSDPDPRLAILVGAVLIGELVPIRLGPGQGEVAPSTTFTFAILLTFGAVPAAVAQGLGSVAADVAHRRRPKFVAFNVSQYLLAVMAAGLVHQLIAGGPHSEDIGTMQLVGVLVAGAVFFAFNTGAVAVAISLSSGTRLKDSLAGDLIRQSATESVLIGLAPLAVVALESNLVLLPLIVLPLLAVQRAARQAQISEHLAMHDALTGLPNRSRFYQRIEQGIAAADADTRIALLLIDLDRFKEINDTLGHHYGDEVLKQVGLRLQQRVALGTTVARLGGDEFAILLPGQDADAALLFADGVRRALGEPLDVAGVRLDIGGSVGVATYPQDGRDVETLHAARRHRDVRGEVRPHGRAALRARAGRGQPHPADARRRPAARARRGRDRHGVPAEDRPARRPRLRRRGARPLAPPASAARSRPSSSSGSRSRPASSSRSRCTCSRTPCARAASGATTACTSPSRSTSPRACCSSPTCLRPSSASAPRTTCRRTRSCSRSPRAWSSPTRSACCRRSTGSPRHGITLSVDDFGTGYSSLEYLKLLPVRELKIDRGFVMGMRTDPRDTAIVRSAIHLGHSLGLRVVAEGVDSAPTHDALAALDCDQAQGFRYSPALPAPQLLSWATDYDERHTRRPVTGPPRFVAG